ncbi:MAG TPA: APC family permease [Candidatus Eisenbacteria bacterium]|nr:APC family permease [Candidatus Eisenbacteria bacterium]
MSLLLKKVERPRELTWYQASSMLYGDWGTSKAYVLGLAFAIAGHASLFFLLAMSLLTALVGYCYMILCKAYPDGGGVYSALRTRNRTLAVVGALLLIADYVVTASLSALAAFHYLGVPYPVFWAVIALVAIGLINIVGPTKSGNVAAAIALPVLCLLVLLCIRVLPYVRNIQISLPEGSLFSNWTKFVGIVLALSGVEAIANVTGIMVEPVKKTAKRAILPVLFEVTVVSLVLGAAMNAIPGLTGRTEDMIRAIGEYYVGPWYGKLIGVLMSLLLLSACNTAIMGLISIKFLMAKDKELPSVFASLNRYGMPWFGLLVAVVVPVVVLGFERDIQGLAALYAIGVVGAIAINLGACCTNAEIDLRLNERVVLGVAAAIMAVVEITIIFEKHQAVIFASTVLFIGLAARSTAQWIEGRRVVVPEVLGVNVLTVEEARDLMPLYKGSTLVAIKAVSVSLIEESATHAKGKQEEVVYTLYVEEKPPGWAYPTEVEPSDQAVKVLNEAAQEFEKRGITAVPLWQLGHDAGALIVKTSVDLGLDTVMIGTTKRGAVERLLRGEVLKRITEQLPAEKHLVICN